MFAFNLKNPLNTYRKTRKNKNFTSTLLVLLITNVTLHSEFCSKQQHFSIISFIFHFTINFLTFFTLVLNIEIKFDSSLPVMKFLFLFSPERL